MKRRKEYARKERKTKIKARIPKAKPYKREKSKGNLAYMDFGE